MLEEALTFSISRAEHGERLDRILAMLLAESGLSREQCKKHILEGRVRVNGVVVLSSKAPLKEGDSLEITVLKPESELVPEEGGLKVIYSDAQLLVVDKPAGLTVHPCPSCLKGTLVHRLVHHFPDLEGGGQRPGIVHRLDKDTSGLLLVARTEKCRLALSEMFARREVDKTYTALVHGVPRPAAGEINAPLARHPTNKTRMAVQAGGREAVTRYRTAYADPGGRFALLDIQILTGRTHQIRAHFAHIGHPLWGDRAYGGKSYLEETGAHGAEVAKKRNSSATKYFVAARQMLHARRLAFRHPDSNARLEFTLPVPEDFRAALAALLKRPLRLVITGLPGCGKSSLLEALAEDGIPVFSADEVVSRLYAPGGAAWDLLNRRFSGRFTPNAALPVDRATLSAAMQESQTLRREVEHLVHPLVEAELAFFWIKDVEAPLAAAEIPLYFEIGWHARRVEKTPQAFGNIAPSLSRKSLLALGGRPLPLEWDEHIIAVISCPEEIRLTRLMEKGFSPEKAQTLDSWQWKEADKIKAGHLVLYNDEGRQKLHAAAKELISYLNLLCAGRMDAALTACLAALDV